MIRLRRRRMHLHPLGFDAGQFDRQWWWVSLGVTADIQTFFFAIEKQHNPFFVCLPNRAFTSR
jgi:hypothetical protein